MCKALQPKFFGYSFPMDGFLSNEKNTLTALKEKVRELIKLFIGLNN